MISHKSRIKMAKKWQMLASLRERICAPPTITKKMSEDRCTSSSRAEEGHFTLYTVDQRRFMIPLSYLKKDVFRELLEAAEEEFGLQRDGPITVPCDAIFMEHVLSVIQKHSDKDLYKALDIARRRCLSTSHALREQRSYQPPICSF